MMMTSQDVCHNSDTCIRITDNKSERLLQQDGSIINMKKMFSSFSLCGQSYYAVLLVLFLIVSCTG